MRCGHDARRTLRRASGGGDGIGQFVGGLPAALHGLAAEFLTALAQFVGDRRHLVLLDTVRRDQPGPLLVVDVLLDAGVGTPFLLLFVLGVLGAVLLPAGQGLQLGPLSSLQGAGPHIHRHRVALLDEVP